MRREERRCLSRGGAARDGFAVSAALIWQMIFAMDHYWRTVFCGGRLQR